MRSIVTLHETGKNEKDIKQKVIAKMSHYLEIDNLLEVEKMVYAEINARPSENDPGLFDATIHVRVR